MLTDVFHVLRNTQAAHAYPRQVLFDIVCVDNDQFLRRGTIAYR